MTATATRRSATTQIALVVVAQVTTLSCWFSLTAVAPTVQADFGLEGVTAVMMTSSVQVGFACGAILSAVLGAADRVPAPLLYSGCAAVAAACTAALVLVGSSAASLLALRFLTGVSLAGVYPVGMKLIASWTTPRRRGLALGALVGALTIGSALPYAIRGTTELPWRGVLLAAAAITAGGALLALTLVRTGPQLPGGRSAFRPGYLLELFGVRDARRAIVGYVGHMWELYALWTWLPLYLAAHRSLDTSQAFVVSFTAIGLMGAVGCLLGGVVSDRWGRAPAASTALGVSGLCCLLSPVVILAPTAVVLVFVAIWGASVIADSAVFSAALSESVDDRYVGTALTAQTAIGYLVTAVSIHAVGALGEATSWTWALAALAIGPAVGAPTIARFGRSNPERIEP